MNANVTSPAPSAPTPSGGRARALTIITVLVVLGLISYGIWWSIFSSHFESTDDAYVAGNVVQLTSQVGGTVVSIGADDTELVKEGKPLIVLDQADARVSLEQAEAQLAQTVREVRTLFANNNTLQANIAVRRADLERAKADVKRRQELIATGAVSKEELEHARNALESAQSALQVTEQQLAASHVLTDHTSIESHPNVVRASASLRAAFLAYARSTIPAPVTGYVAKRSVQIGQRISAGAPLLSIVPLNAVWVDANFKEVQLAHMRIGQPVTLRSDIYGSEVLYHGKLAGLSAGTGSAFALLPSQNASGNWIKIVQRVPVRIALDPKELSDHPLRIGLSMQVKVDIANTQGSALAAGESGRSGPAFETKVFEAADREADARIAEIIAKNAGGVTKSAEH